MKQQIILIHGGDSFKTYKDYLNFLKSSQFDLKSLKKKRKDWKDNLSQKLGKDFEIIYPVMPNKRNAKYLEWKIWFEKLIPYIKSEVILIGHSLGGIFLAKYLSENKFPKKIKAVFLIAAPYCNVPNFKLPKNLNKLEKQSEKIFIYYSKDDPLVPLADFKKYQKELKNATIRFFTNRGHFNQSQLPGLIRDIKNLRLNPGS
jgi:hypothetical protein